MPTIRILPHAEYCPLGDTIEALAEIGDVRAAAPITEALNDKQKPVRQAAQRALQRLGAGSAG